MARFTARFAWLAAALFLLPLWFSAATAGSLAVGDSASSHRTVEPTVLLAAANPETKLNRKQRTRIQKALNKRGFDTGRPDGAFGKNTRAAIRNYQTATGAAPTGTLTADQIDDLLGRGKGGAVQAASAGGERRGDAVAWFEVLEKIDLEGGDIRLPWKDPELQDVSDVECRALCENEAGCRAFTFNTKARMCFLKGDGYRKTWHADAKSGIARDVPVRPAPPPPRSTDSFFGFQDVEFVGADLPGGSIDEKDCFAVCSRNPICVAYTIKDGKCFPKSAGYSAVKSPGATSSVREGHAPVKGFPVLPLPDGIAAFDVTRRAAGDESDHVARVREAAAAFGKSCETERPEVERLQQATSVSVARTSVSVGEELKVRWSRESTDEALPVYLLISTDQPVRFTGDNFYAVTPGARVAFGIETFGSRTRAVIPFSSIAMPTSGEVGIHPLLAGDLEIAWSVVGYLRQCQEELATAPVRATVKVAAASRAEIALQETSSLVDPLSVQVSPDGSRRVEVYEGRYRILSADGAEVAERVGANPVFSPTGRFIVAEAEDATEIVDTVDGALVTGGGFNWSGTGAIGWRNRDSVAISAGGGWGAVTLTFPLIEGEIWGNGGSSHADSGAKATLTIDYENGLLYHDNYIVMGGGPDPLDANHYFSFYDVSATTENERLSRTRRYYAERFSRLSLFDPGPEAPWGETSLRTGDTEAAVEQAAATTVSLAADTELHNVSAWRGLQLLDEPINGRNLKSRIADVGLSSIPPRDLTFSHVRPFGWEEGVGNRYPEEIAKPEGKDIANRIVDDFPEASGMFVEGVYQCGSFGNEYVTGPEREQLPEHFHGAFRWDLRGRRIWVTHRMCHEGSGAFNSPTIVLFDSAFPEKPVNLLEDISKEYPTGTGCEGSIANCALSVALFDDRYLVFWSRETRAVAILDLSDHKVIFKKYELDRGDLLDGFLFSPETGHLTQLNTDGSFFVYRMADWSRVFEGRYVDDEVVVWTPDLHFDATAEGASFVTMKFPGQTGLYTFQQFDSRLRVPGLVEKVLAGTYQPDVTAVGVPPRLAGQLAANGDGRVTGTANAEAAGALDALLVYQDGILTDRVETPAAGGDIAIDVARLAGSRWTSLVAVDDEGLVSLPMGRDLGADPTANPAVHVLAVGVDQYAAPEIVDLELAVKDAGTLVDGIASADGKTLAVRPPTLLTDAEATPEAVLAAAETMVAEAKAGETVVFFFAGHGIKGPDGRFYMATSGIDLADIPGTALSWDDLSAVLARSKARVAIFLDACHSGAAGTDFFATNDDAATGILKTIPSGLVVFSASKGREFSEESQTVGGGVFTNAVADVIARKRDTFDTNGNGVIEVSELYAGVKRQVVRQTEGRQTPWLARNQMVGDFAFF